MSSTDLSGSSRALHLRRRRGRCVRRAGVALFNFTSPVGSNWLVLAVLTLLSGSFTVRIPGIPARLSVSETFVFAAALLFGPPAATMIVVLDTLVISFWLGRQSAPPWSQANVQCCRGSRRNLGRRHTLLLLYWNPTTLSLSKPNRSTPALAASAGHCLLPAQQLARGDRRWPSKRRSPLSVWRQSFLWLSLNYYSGASVAALILPILHRQVTPPSCTSAV